MKTHTPEPWHQSHRENTGGMYNTEIYDAEGKTIATLHWYAIKGGKGITTTNREANARRIVACVNACADIPTELLESKSQTPRDAFRSLAEQRNELLAALKSVLKVSDAAAEDDEYGPEWQGAIETMRAAIIKAEAVK